MSGLEFAGAALGAVVALLTVLGSLISAIWWAVEMWHGVKDIRDELHTLTNTMREQNQVLTRRVDALVEEVHELKVRVARLET